VEKTVAGTGGGGRGWVPATLLRRLGWGVEGDEELLLLYRSAPSPGQSVGVSRSEQMLGAPSAGPTGKLSPVLTPIHSLRCRTGVHAKAFRATKDKKLEHPATYVNAIGCAVPEHDVHALFIDWAKGQIESAGDRALFHRMAERSGIDHRWSVLKTPTAAGSENGFYSGSWPSTSERMSVYEREAPRLALSAIEALAGNADLASVTHLVVASCTGFVAPGIDQIIAEALGLRSVERTLVGFMGCYAAVAALRLARHIVRSEPAARVLVVTVELSSLLAMLQFGDGAAAALVTGQETGFALQRQFAVTVPQTAGLIRWSVGDTGFSMHLSGEVPGCIARALEDEKVRAAVLGDRGPDEVDCWAVHAGGRSILKAVQRGFGLGPHALDASHDVLARYGNMSSSTLMFALAGLLAGGAAGRGVALAFGPGLAAEGFEFERRA
jgi:alpha-pyrone synthase